MASPSSPAFSKANTTFFLALFRKLSDEDKTANIFHSPLSISAALAMVMLGSRGDTAAQMSEVLGFSKSENPSGMIHQMMQMMQVVFGRPPQAGEDVAPQVHAEFAHLLSALNKADAPYSLSVANRLYGEKTTKFIKKFLADTKKYYGAEPESVDFRTKAEEARVNINRWAEEKTQGKIQEVLLPGDVDSLTRLVLINAIYFKGSWSEPFEKFYTVDDQFRMNKNETKPVRMMRMTSDFAYRFIPQVNIKILEIPYKGKDLSMIILLPDGIEDDTTGLERLEKELTFENFVKWTDMRGQTEVVLKLPRFKIETGYNMGGVLESMGIVDAFDVSRSNFSGMSPADDLFLSKVVHKAFVEVNEEGTEAAAFNLMNNLMCSKVGRVKEPVTFYADHPFLFFIRHNPSRTILFAGRFCSPERSPPADMDGFEGRELETLMLNSSDGIK